MNPDPDSHSGTNGAAPSASGGANANARPVSKTVSAPKRWLFRLLAVVGIPAVFVALIELGLRFAGVGYPVSFFLEETTEGKRYMVQNSRFGWLFFPKSLARSPTPTRFIAQKPEGTIRIFVFGESAALGDPRPAYGFARYLEVLLQERFPGAKFEVIPAAMTAINSHALVRIAHESAALQGDFWVVYMGNNEMAGPFGANTVFGAQAPDGGLVRAILAVKSTRIGQVLTSMGERLRKQEESAAWEGLKMFLDHPLPPGDPRRAAVYKNFRRNLQEIAGLGVTSGAKVIVSSVACNLKDCAPFVSTHSKTLPSSELDRWNGEYSAALTNARAGNLEAAYASWTNLARADSGYAELQFQLGSYYYENRRTNEALTALVAARDLDALPFRADGSLNAIVEEVAASMKDRGVEFVDAQASLARRLGGRIAGQELFYEHVHFNPAGNYLLAGRFAEVVARQLPEIVQKSAKSEWASFETCCYKLGLTDWNRAAVLESVIARVSDAPFTNQLNAAARLRMLVTDLGAARKRAQPANQASARYVYQEAIKARPGDSRIQENYAEFLDAVGDPKGALLCWQKVKDLMPRHDLADFQIGRIQLALKDPGAARVALEAAIATRPDFLDARLELSRALQQLGLLPQATQCVEEAAVLKPGDVRVLLRQADLQAAAGHRAEALATLQRAARSRPGYWEARYYLGVEYAALERVEEARMEFEAVTKLRPSYPLGHLNYGVCLVRAGKLSEAAQEFQATLRLDPHNALARKHLDSLTEILVKAGVLKPGAEPELPLDGVPVEVQ